ncbi:MAG: YwiC-like family protein [Candidatus Cohnella colombiensis]|uniref:YwiC-like family protein n=1 Tax=Candidatus Cohnella colombiensis TaxID=3121368 RepID=A0AA95EYT5_9BACL|nr:MAG: YwiC-like family protein [Cohnella sp.]
MKQQRTIVIPHEHGGWAMVSVPFLLGMMAGSPNYMHALLFVAWLCLYLSSYPFLQAVKRSANRSYYIQWGIGYGIVGLICLIPSLLYSPELFFFGIPLVLLLLVNIWHAKAKSERAIVNDLCAIMIFAIGGAAAYILGDGTWDHKMGMIVLFSFIYFTGTALFVKSVFREKNNVRWHGYSRIYHIVMLIVPFVAGYPLMALAYAFAIVRALLLAGKSIRPMKVGIIEIVGVVLFLIFSVVALS